MDKELTCTGDKKAADVIRKVMTNVFDVEFTEIATSGASFVDTFGQSVEEETDAPGLVGEVQAFRACLRDGPVPAKDHDDSQFDAPPGDEEAEHKAKVMKQVLAARKSSIQFIASDMLKTPDYWKKGNKATAQYQKSKFIQAGGEPGKQNHCMLMCAELFPTREMFALAAPHKDPVPVTLELKQAAKWVAAAQGGNTVCVFLDGRSKKVRRVFEDIVEEGQTDEQKHLDGCILYGQPNRKDVRFHKRKTFSGLSNFARP